MRDRIWKHELVGVIGNHIAHYPTPVNITYMWGFGSLAGMCLVIQIVTGIFLGMHYKVGVETAMASIEYIMREVNYGWFIRYLHANGASSFFVVVYIHMLRGLYYGSYTRPREHIWLSGVLLFLLMMGTGFIGYVLPWGQMSLWGATVITNMVSAVPLVGMNIAEWLWGGYVVGEPTLSRFYSFHYVLPFVLAGLALAHIALVHVDGSNNPLGIESKVGKMTFYPYCYVKDLYVFMIMLTILNYIIFYKPRVLGHSDNYIAANSIKTPDHIVPEWYFLPFYAILRTVESKTGGVVLMVGAIASLVIIPYTNTSEVRSNRFRPLMKRLYWIFVADSLLLGWVGGCEVVYPYKEVGQVLTVGYFMYILVVIPLVGLIENKAIRL